MNDAFPHPAALLAHPHRFNALFAARQLERQFPNRPASEAYFLATHADRLIPYPHGPSLTIERAKSLARLLV